MDDEFGRSTQAMAGVHHGVQHGVDEVGKVETRGIDYIPPAERHSNPRNLAWVMCAPEFAFGIMVFGSLPLAFGLGWWASFWAITLGIGVGSLIFGPMGLIGPKTGTNNCVSSGAYFGILGRFIGSAITLFVGLGFFAILVWTGGQAVIACLHRLAGTGTSNLALGLSMTCVCLLSFVLAVYGHASLVRALKWITVTSGLVIVIAVIALAGKFHDVSGAHYVLGSFWPTWVLAFATSASVPISWGPFINDYGRYVPESASRASIFFYASGGMFVGCWISLIAGAFVTTTALAATSSSFVFGLYGVSPTWLIVLMTLTVGGTANMGNAAMGVYNAGLDMHAVIWRVTRAQMTLVLSAVGLGVALIGVIVFNAIDSIEAFVTVMLVTLTPWMFINIVGHFLRGGDYDVYALQAFTNSKEVRGSRYWYAGGFNPRAVAAWAIATGFGLLFVSTSIITGPLVSSVGGITLSFVASGVVGIVLYLGFRQLWPERSIERAQETASVPAAVAPVPEPTKAV